MKCPCGKTFEIEDLIFENKEFCLRTGKCPDCYNRIEENDSKKRVRRFILMSLVGIHRIGCKPKLRKPKTNQFQREPWHTILKRSLTSYS